MEKSKYERATLFLNYIQHLDDLSVFIRNTKDKKLSLMLRESGFCTDPKHILLTEADVDMLLLTIEKEKRELEEAFAAL